MQSDAEYKLEIGDSAPDFKLQGTDSKEYSLLSFKKDILVVFFSCNHCPYAQACEKRVMHLKTKFNNYADFVAINSNDSKEYPEDSFNNMVLRAKQRNFNFVYLRDRTQETAKSYGGECTPHFFVFDKERKLQYQGRLDDNWKDESKVTKSELKEAIQCLVEGKEILEKTTNALGCSIKWK